MEPHQWERVQAAFDRIVVLPRDQQTAAMTEACSDDPEVAREVLELLQEDAAEHSLLDADIGTVAGNALQSDFIRSMVQQQIGHYRLLRLLGEGGMGVVYLAERTDIGGLVAIKLLRDAWVSTVRRDRFLGEQRTLARLNHKAIAHIYEAGMLKDGTPWFVMEFADGQPITDYLRHKQASVTEALRLFRAVCEAVQYAHGLAIIHRDLKPSNIFVTTAGEVRLLDFGIAKNLDPQEAESPATIAGMRLMSPAYAAPEQRSGGTLGVFTDVYALGVLLYEILTGDLPLIKDGFADRVSLKPSQAARQSSSCLANALDRHQAEDLDVICLTAMQPDPNLRYRSADALARDIQAYLEGRPLEARPDTFLYRAGKFLRRRQKALAASACVLLMAAAAGIFFTVKLEHARRDELAEAARTQRIERFMLNLFGAEDQEAGPANDLKVVTLLDRGASQISTLNDDKQTQAELYETLGSMENRLGKYEQSSVLLGRALDNMRQATGDSSVKDAGVLVDLAVLRTDQNKVEEAEHFAAQAAQIVAQHRLPPSDPVAMAVTVASGRVALARGQYARAIELLRPITELRPPYTGSVGYSVRDALEAMANAELYQSQLPAARADFERAIALDRSLLGAGHPRTAEDLLNLASVETTERQLPAAEQTYREGIAQLSNWYGPNNPDVLTAKVFLATALVSDHKPDEAEGVIQDTLPALEKTYGATHERVALAYNLLGDLAYKRADYTTAATDYERAENIARTRFGKQNVFSAVYLSNLGKAHQKLNKAQLAESEEREAVQFLKTLPPGNLLLGTALARWGRSLLAIGDYPKAEEQLTAAKHLLETQANASKDDLQSAEEDLSKIPQSKKHDR